MIYGIKKREYKKEIQQQERQNISKYQNIKRGICIKLIDNLEKKLDRFLEMSKIDNEELKHFNHILGNIKAYLEGKIDKKWIELYCKGDWESCVRYQIEERGEYHPDWMLPDGTIDKELKGR